MSAMRNKVQQRGGFSLIVLQKKMILTFLFLFLVSATIAQYRISGIVTNKEGGEVLPSANITLKETGTVVVSNPDGLFYFDGLKKGNYTIKVDYVGFVSQEKQVVVEKDVQLDIRLEPRVFLAEEVIITATKASDKMPLTFTNVDEEQINRKNMGKDLPFLLTSTPSTVVTSDAGTGVGYTGIRIRGTDLTRINVTLNGVPVNDAESQNVFFVDLPDLASSVDEIQIQRGVGTSSNGAASFGASINIKTDKFMPHVYLELNNAAGSFATIKNTMKFGSGLIKGKFSIDGRLSFLNSQGYVDRASAKMKSMYLASAFYGKKDVVKLIYLHGTEKTYQAWYGIPKDSLETNRTYNPAGSIYDTEGNFLGYYDNQTDNYEQTYLQLHYAHQFGERMNLITTLFYTGGKGFYENYKNNRKFSDYGMSDTVIGGDTITRSSLIEQKWLDNDFYGINMYLNYDAGNLQLNFGAGWNQYLGDHYGKVIWAQIARYGDYDRDWYAGTGNKTDVNVFAKVNYALNEHFSIFADLQFRSINYKIGGTDDNLLDVTQHHTYTFFNPKAGVFYQVNEKHKLYLSAAVSHREPNRSDFLDADPGRQVDPEQLIDYELGYSWQTNHVLLNANLFYMDYKDQLVMTGKINNVGAAVMTNVPKSYRAGIELAAGFRLFRIVDWNLNAAFSQNKILDFTEYVDNWNYWDDPENEPYQYERYLGTTDISFSPDWVAGSNLGVTPFKGFTVTLVTNYVSRQYIDNTSNVERSLDPYLVNNLQFFYRLKVKHFRAIEFLLSLNNIFNEKYETNAWVYRYVDGTEHEMNGYFPQAGFNVMGGVNLKF